MKIKIVSGIMLTLLFVSMLTLAFKIQPVKAEPTTWTVDDDGPADFSKIQDAVNAASLGDTIFVYNGTYYENVVVNKNNLTLVGESPRITFIDGNGTGSVVTITASNVNISNFTIQHSGPAWNDGIKLISSSYNAISGNNVANNWNGIQLSGSSFNSISGNNITANNHSGIPLYQSSNNNIVGNDITANGEWGIYLGGSSNNSIFGNNIKQTTIQDGIQLSASSNYNIISRNNITANGQDGIDLYGELGSCNYNIIVGNNIAANNWDGIYFYGSSNNIISGNNITNNSFFGMLFDGSSNNRIYHNNFVNNGIYSLSSVNVWDDGYPSGGNYWSNYAGVDMKSGPAQDQPGSDGIGDTPYVMDANNRDRYPLMNLWFPVPPMANFSYSPEFPLVGETITFNASTSYNPDGYITSYKWDFGDGNITTVTTPIITYVYMINGTYTANLTITNVYGLSDSTIKFVTVIADFIPPTTIHDYDGLWHTTNFTINLTATDTIPGSGVEETYYEVNNGPTQNVGTHGQPLITTEGDNNTLEYWSVDNAENEELPHKILTGIKLDKTAPTGSITINNDTTYATSTSVTLTLTSTDATSGVYQVRYSNDGVWDTEPWEDFSAIKTWILALGDGTKTVYYQIKDNAGLISTYSDTITSDATAPVIGIPSREPAGDVQPDQPVKISVNVTDIVSQVENVTLSYTINDEPTWTNLPMNYNSSTGLYEVTIPPQEAGTWIKYKIVAYDYAGNNETLDGTEPYCTYQVIPEFSSSLILPLFMIITLLAVIVYRRRKHSM